MKKYLLTAAALLILNGSIYAAHYPTNLEGTYDCNCIEVGTQEKSTGVMTITKTDQTYSIKSTYTDGSTYEGTGIYDSNKHILSAAFVNPKKADETGIVVADVKKDNSMTSNWTYLQKTTLGQGSCKKRSSNDKA